jgi:hypothetical protein
VWHCHPGDTLGTSCQGRCSVLVTSSVWRVTHLPPASTGNMTNPRSCQWGFHFSPCSHVRKRPAPLCLLPARQRAHHTPCIPRAQIYVHPGAGALPTHPHTHLTTHPTPDRAHTQAKTPPQQSNTIPDQGRKDAKQREWGPLLRGASCRKVSTKGRWPPLQSNASACAALLVSCCVLCDAVLRCHNCDMSKPTPQAPAQRAALVC